MEHLEPSRLSRLATGDISEASATERLHLEQCEACTLALARLRKTEEATLQVPPLAQPQSASPSAEAGSTPRSGSGPQPTQPQPTPLPSEYPGELLELVRGSSVGRYLILHVLGEGGMGVVYAAYDPELDRKVALKLLLAPAHRSASQEWLLREAQALARISHPNVVPVFDVGVFAGQVFMAMELVEGTTLRAWLQGRPRAWREVLPVLVQAGQGLAAAHAVDLAHRDFKPDNILIRNDGRVQVVDFGVAGLVTTASTTTAPEARTEAREQSPAGMVVGTPAYMAPEQHRGQPTDARADQFAFCTTLYLALYGQRPFEARRLAEAACLGAGLEPSSSGGTPTWRSDSSTTQTTEPLIRPPPRSPYVPSWVKRAMMRGLALHPQERFASMEELLARLREPPATVRRGRWVAAGLALMAVGAVVSTLVVRPREEPCTGAAQQLAQVWDEAATRRLEEQLLSSGKPYAPSTLAAVKARLDSYSQEWVRMHTEACLATRVRGEQSESVLERRMVCLERRRKHLGSLVAVLAAADGAVVEKAVDAAWGLPSLADCADVGALLALESLPQLPAVRARVLEAQAQLAEAKVLEDAGRYTPALELAQQVVSAAEALPYRPLRAEALLRVGVLHERLGKVKPSEQALSQAVWLAEAADHGVVKIEAATKLMRVVTLFQQSRYDAAQIWYELAEAALQRAGGDLEREALLLVNRCWILCGAGRCAETLEPLKRMLQRVEHELPANHFVKPILLMSMAPPYQAQGNLGRAREVLERSVALTEQNKGVGHPATLLGLLSLVPVLSELGEHARALEYAERSRVLAEQRAGPQGMLMATALDAQGVAMREAGRVAEALELHERALAMREKVVGPSHAALCASLAPLGEALLAAGRPAEGLRVLERAWKLDPVGVDMRTYVAFALSKALVATGRERARALKLVEEQIVQARGASLVQEAAKMERWLQSQRR